MNSVFRPRARAEALGFLILVLALSLLVRLPFLVLADQEGSPVLYLPLLREEAFSLFYVHSVHRTPVRENFRSGPGDRLVLDSVVFDSLGVGLPFLPGEGKLTNDQGRFVLTGQGRVFPEIVLGVSPVAAQALLYRDRRYDLNSRFTAGASIRLRLDRLSPAAVLWQRFAHGRELLD